MKIRLSTEAVSDLRNIYEYGSTTFGIPIADTYLDALLSAFQTLESNPQIGRLDSLADPAIRRYIVAQHIIFYDLLPSQIKIIRILHHTQDHPAQLSSP